MGEDINSNDPLSTVEDLLPAFLVDINTRGARNEITGELKQLVGQMQ